MYIDLVSLLPDDILTKVDRATMAVSVEARVLLLDHRVVEFAWSLPMSMKLRMAPGSGRSDRFSTAIFHRSSSSGRSGGSVFHSRRSSGGALRDWAEELLVERRLREEGNFSPEALHAVWREHLIGRGNYAFLLWPVLMFQGWLREN